MYVLLRCVSSEVMTFPLRPLSQFSPLYFWQACAVEGLGRGRKCGAEGAGERRGESGRERERELAEPQGHVAGYVEGWPT